MKVLFAVSNDNISSSIIKKYQEKYKEIITSKNVYYFNAIIKELQKDKTYDAVVIGEDLEPISNNNYDTIDKFIFDKLDNISDEAYKSTGEDIPIILICSDRRTKADGLLIKLFGIGIYNALLGNDRNIDMVCNLINKPRSKKEAKNYYKIDSEDVNYKPESESEVSENEIKNILNHYKKIGNNEKKCIESFDSIASQYNDTQLRIIVKFLPNTVKSILEKGSPRYQKLVNGGTVLTNGNYVPYSPNQNNVKKPNIDFITKDIEKPNITEPVIIPKTIDIENDMQRNNKINQSNVGANQLNTTVSQPNTVTSQLNPVFTQPNTGASQLNTPVSQPSAVANTINTPISQPSAVANTINTPISQQSVVASQLDTTTSQINTAISQNNKEEGNQIQNQNAEVVHVKRRGRPKKINAETNVNETKENQDINSVQPTVESEVQPVKRGRGRPKKANVVASDLEQKNSVEKNEPEQNMPKLREQTALAEQNAFNLFELGKEEQNNDMSNQNSNITSQNNSTGMDNNSINNDINLFDMGNSYGNEFMQETAQSQYDTPNVQNPYNIGAEQQNIQNPYNVGAEQQNIQNPYNVGAEQQNMQTPYNIGVDQQNVQTPYNTGVEQNYFNIENTNDMTQTNPKSYYEQSNFVAQNKIVAFVGTSKNGTSFIVNNLAELLAQKGIKTAILDLTKNKNSYYMFTDNDQRLMQIATQSIKNLENGIAQGVEVNKNLTVYTALPDEIDDNENFEAILQTLDNNYSAILMDCDFATDINYFIKATEIYLVQSMDALTIQPLTQFLSELKLKNALNENKLRVIINKEMKLKILNDKMILGGMAKYNEPSMTLQRDLFNPATIKYVTIPFEMQTYARYLEAIAICQISLSGYSQTFLNSLEQLANMVYPLISGGNYTNYSPNYEKAEKRGFFKSKNKKQPPTQFSSGVNDTLNKMRSNY